MVTASTFGEVIHIVHWEVDLNLSDQDKFKMLINQVGYVMDCAHADVFSVDR